VQHRKNKLQQLIQRRFGKPERLFDIKEVFVLKSSIGNLLVFSSANPHLRNYFYIIFKKLSKKMKSKYCILLPVMLVLFFSCSEPASNKPIVKVKQRNPPAAKEFHLAKAKEWLAHNDSSGNNKAMDIVLAVNRTDADNFSTMDSVIVPNDFSGDLEYYLPFPFSAPAIKQINKIIFFSYPAQAFAAYENGELVYTGPVNMGRKKDPTPTGLFFANWKAEKTNSTFNDEWELRWNVNIANKLGVGWHQYSLPGYPASHSCLRLQEKDARSLYKWADEWVLKDAENITLQGTPVIVFGAYDFDAPKPWLQLVTNPEALNISENEIDTITRPFVTEIMKWQEKRQAASEK
jgi:hypothetical protein